MRNLILCGTALLACMVTPVVVAGALYNVSYNSENRLTWHDADHSLSLHSDANNGIWVTGANPKSVWGLHQGDKILAIDGHPVKNIAELLDKLRMSKPKDVKLLVHRDDAQQVLTVSASDYMSIVGPEPPNPPIPPAPPMRADARL